MRHPPTWTLLLSTGLVCLGLVAGCDGRRGETTPSGPSARPPRDLSPAASREAAIEALIPRLEPLHARKHAPRAGEWLAEHDEPGQSYAAYRNGHPVTPDPQRRVLYVESLGDLSGAHATMVKEATTYLSLFFGLDVRRRPGLPLSLVPAGARRHKHGAHQVLSGYVLRELLAPRLPKDAAAYISFTTEDLFPGEGWNFVFGQASLEDRVGVWSMHRYGDPEAGPQSLRQILWRTLRVAAHETSHMFSMRHCTAYECVMNGVNNLAEADRTPLWLCPECLAKILWATGQDGVVRYEKLAAFAEGHGLAREAAFFQRSAEALRLGVVKMRP